MVIGAPTPDVKDLPGFLGHRPEGLLRVRAPVTSVAARRNAACSLRKPPDLSPRLSVRDRRGEEPCKRPDPSLVPAGRVSGRMKPTAISPQVRPSTAPTASQDDL